ncbi:hypothetical protein EHW99_1922 [Erwinia amylovora]|uniref:Uncharacterized protein n=2 Tax=Erwinia amylovora TaxID=552 RepID=A0A831A4K1_ERWAM|nr:hypothetical protein EHX00_1922 [Erwinia amylovora]CBA20611.1 hypothetical protein predicted by Glimmer/Critica [Erwinia amylovora CFBP1430]CCO78514.1 hypothetical protein BN432_1712 [Erwinia amylovora Ea356]CCO93641.1 hypothetical protein BN437_1707 [Erwinia amylovora NBRC 12687 = CFBP 1232]QJQ58324.1 hypothetical protein EHW99_1922 [Erwinia amylovora]
MLSTVFSGRYLRRWPKKQSPTCWKQPGSSQRR